jgi:RND family efflux transporter MFP subunit
MTLRSGSFPVVAALLAVLCVPAGCGGDTKAAKAAANTRPALSVTAVTPASGTWPRYIQASGSVAPWQEAVIGSEINGLRLAEVLVNVGDAVKKGQVLARFADETVRNDYAQQEAALKEAEAMLAQAKFNIERALALEPSGSMSKQEILGYQTQAATSAARVDSAKVLVAAQKLRLGYTQVTSPDDGAISSRTATVGSVVAQGQEMFKLIRQNRLEWRGEMRAEDLARAKPGQAVELQRPDGSKLVGKVRQIAPTVDPGTRLGFVYVDIPPNAALHAGMFITGSLLLPSSPAMTLPQSAIVDRDGLHYTYLIKPDSHAVRVKVALGRRQGGEVEILEGLNPDDRVVASGGAFLNDGDLVRVVDAAPAKGAAR